jgi:hypothetical protein
MCPPPLMAAVAAALSATGQLVGGLQSAAMSRYQAKVEDRNAALEAEAATTAAEAGRTEAQRLYRKSGALQGQQIAAQAANNIDTSFGSAVQVQEDTANMGAEDIDAIYRQTYQNVRGFDINAANARARAQGARQAGKGALVKAGFGAASSILGGASQFSQMGGKF